MRIKVTLALLLGMSIGVQAKQSVVHYKIHQNQSVQTMDHFSASDAWSMQIIGNWEKEKTEQVADWLFSTECDSKGNPKGIGLSLWRFNLGAGSTEQGDASGIGSKWTRTECFLNEDGTYDWNKQRGQRVFLRLAKARGVEKFLAFFNSPPVYFTQNGLATNIGRGGTFNLQPYMYDDFARFIATVIEGVEKHDGIKFNYICPVNEPDGHWNWTGNNQEGTPATNREIAKAVKCISSEFVKRGIDTQILVNESSDYRCMTGIHMTDWQRGNSISTFFCPDSTETYLGNTPNVPRLMAGHSYWTNTPLKSLRDKRCELRDTMAKYDVQFWQTETCIMSNDDEIGGGGGYDTTMKTALYVARIIHHDLVYANARSWQWWRAIGGDYKDGLIREFSNESLTDGRVIDSKLLWSLGNYSRFIRPEAVRKEITATSEKGKIIPEGHTDVNGLMCSAYLNKDGRWVVVVVNYSKDDRIIDFKIDKKCKVNNWNAYRTSDVSGENLSLIAQIKTGNKINIPSRSITTFVSAQ